MFSLLRQRNFALLWLGGFISILGDRVLLVALPYYVYQETGSTLATSIMVAARLLPGFLLGSVAGVFVDRWNRQKVMALTSLGQAVILLPLVLVHRAEMLWVIYLVTLAQTGLAVFFEPAENALLPLLVKEDQLVPANALNALNNNLARLIGPPLGGVLLAYAGLSGVIIFDSLTFLVAAGMIAIIRLTNLTAPAHRSTAEPAAQGNGWKRFVREWQDSLVLIRGDRVVLVLFFTLVLVNFGGILLDPLAVPFLSGVVRADVQTYGLLMTVQAVGGITGGLLAARLGSRFPAVPLYGWSCVVISLLQLLRYNLPLIPVVFVTGMIIGLPAALFAAASDTLFQQNVPNHYLGRVSGVLSTTISILSLGGVLGIAGKLGDEVGVVPVLNFAALVTLGAGILGVVMLPRAGRGDAVTRGRGDAEKE
jgi:MFS family permease